MAQLLQTHDVLIKVLRSDRVWKHFDFATMDALHAKGLIAEPRGRQESVYLTDEGMARAKERAAKHFGVLDPSMSG
ncbi:MAG: DUF6429 family protein [Variovorax sp.]